MTDPVPLPRQSRRWLVYLMAALAMTSATIVSLAAVGWWPRDGVLVAAFVTLMVVVFGALFAGWIAVRRWVWRHLAEMRATSQEAA